MTQVSATAASAGAAAPSIAGQPRVRMSKVYKTAYGQFWHFEALGRRRSGYLQTACGRRLGRWHLLPVRGTASMPVEAICSGCVRKVTS